jgi:hypothetical protein
LKTKLYETCICAESIGVMAVGAYMERFRKPVAIVAVLASAVLAVALAGPPSVAAATSGKIVEETWPCAVAHGATLPAPVIGAELGAEPWVPLSGYFAASMETGEKWPPATDFLATISWGDGTSSPAKVSLSGVGGCYVVSATENHRYQTTGTYVTHYVVRDESTGEELTFEGHEVRIWTNETRLIGGPSSRVIHATAGTSWTGVVAEFAYEPGMLSIGISPYMYAAQIAWEPGIAPTQATVDVEANNTIAVVGSFTYAKDYNGIVNVLLSYFGRPLGAWAASSVAMNEHGPAPISVPVKSAPHFRFVGRPLLARIPGSGRRPEYVLLFRLSGRLSRAASGHPLAFLKANGRQDPISGHLGQPRSACYEARVSRVPPHLAKPGHRDPFTLVISGQSPLNSAAAVRSFSSTGRMRSDAGRILGCGGGDGIPLELT